MTPIAETPANQIFYTHGTRPPQGVRTIPSGMANEIKGNKKQRDHNESLTPLQNEPFKREQEMMQMMTKVP